MLTTEQIKEAVERFNPDGFDLINDGDDIFEEWNIYIGGLYYLIDHIDDFVYDLFLDRVIQGINREFKFQIHQLSGAIVILSSVERMITFGHDGSTEGIREAREKAIVFVLEELNK